MSVEANKLTYSNDFTDSKETVLFFKFAITGPLEVHFIQSILSTSKIKNSGIVNLAIASVQTNKIALKFSHIFAFSFLILSSFTFSTFYFQMKSCFSFVRSLQGPGASHLSREFN